MKRNGAYGKFLRSRYIGEWVHLCLGSRQTLVGCLYLGDMGYALGRRYRLDFFIPLITCPQRGHISVAHASNKTRPRQGAHMKYGSSEFGN